MDRYVGALNKAFYTRLSWASRYDIDTKIDVILTYLGIKNEDLEFSTQKGLQNIFKDREDFLGTGNDVFIILLAYNIFGWNAKICDQSISGDRYVDISRRDVEEYVMYRSCPVLYGIEFKPTIMLNQRLRANGQKHVGTPRLSTTKKIEEAMYGMRYREDIIKPFNGSPLPSDTILEGWEHVEYYLYSYKETGSIQWMIDWMYSYLIDTDNPTEASTALTSDIDLRIRDETGATRLATKSYRDVLRNLLRAYNFDASNCKGAYKKYKKVYTPTKEDLSEYILKEPYGYRGTGYTFDDYLDFKLGILDCKLGYRIEYGALKGYYCYPGRKVSKRKMGSEPLGNMPFPHYSDARNTFWGRTEEE